MNSVGEFGEKEVDGEPFRIFTFSSQISSEAAIDHGSEINNLPPQPRFLCPSLRFDVEKLKNKAKGYSKDIPFSTSPHFPNKKCINHYCKLPVLPLFWCNNEKSNYDSYCAACKTMEIGTDRYFCVKCRGTFHKECVESPLFIKHPSFPFLSLQLYTPSRYLDDVWSCISCKSPGFNMSYYCPTNKVSIHPVCGMKPIPILVDHPKRHPHSLTFFPKQNSLACDVCGMIKEFIPTYICARCVFVVHQDCIYFPYVIRISRHQHRISFTYSLPSKKLSCGVCRQKVDSACGAYSCNQCDRGYYVHSRCALRKDLWDGEELEGVPEEIEIDVEPFETIGDGIIHHFSHDHYLKLEISKVYDENKCCQACILPIYEGNYYSCVDVHCDFILHETCANAPRKKHHPLHAHSLTLKIVTPEYKDNKEENEGHFLCHACLRNSCGFVYEKSIGDEVFRLDLRCASISEPFHYQGHEEHPLFLALTPEEEKSAICQICHATTKTYGGNCRKLNCIECNFIICFRCATLPYKARYKHDKHFLTFRKEGKVVESDQSGWCESCESKIVYSREGGFYACDDYCCTTLHVDCLLGKDPYMKHGQIIKIDKEMIHIIRNNTMTRPPCHFPFCEIKRCPYRVVFVKKHLRHYCSYFCSKW